MDISDVLGIVISTTIVIGIVHTMSASAGG